MESKSIPTQEYFRWNSKLKKRRGLSRRDYVTHSSRQLLHGGSSSSRSSNKNGYNDSSIPQRCQSSRI